jgi:16S rRNA (guanine1516-N2)-methyltransferase
MSLASFYPENLNQSLCVYASDADTLGRAQRFAENLNLQLFRPDQIADSALLPYPYVLVYQQHSAFILQTGKSAPGPVSASFLQGKTTHRLMFGGGKGQMIAKAVGLNKGVNPIVLDATAGLAQDAFVLASLGCQVTMLERSPVVAELVAVALEEARSSEIADIVSRMNLLAVDACAWLREQTEAVADVIYLDPMYPHRDKTALVKKEMRLFHTLVGETADDAQLLAAALEKARYRVVVKRPRKGETIAGRQPAHQIIGKSCRYDIYPLQRMENLKL